MGFIPSEKDYFDESQFKPTWTKEATASRLNLYYRVPHTFTDSQLQTLQAHANHYKMEIQQNEKTLKDDEVKFTRLLGKLGQGFFSGFTTFNVGDEPKNTWEGIASSLGNLAGFVGYIPTAPLKLLNATKLVGAAKALKGRSVPLIAANKIQSMVNPVAKKALEGAATGRSDAVRAAAAFMLKDKPKHIAEGAFHLGVASAIGSWQGGINQMMTAGLHGGFAGGAFRGIAELINKGGAKTLVRTVEKDAKGRPMPAKVVLTADQKQDKLIRGLAGSLFDGLPSTLRGDTTPEQVYHYLLGAYFGSQETTAVEGRRNKFFAKMEKENGEQIRSARKVGLEKGLKGDKLKDFVENQVSDKLNYVPELVPGWDNLSKEVQTSVKDEAARLYGYKADSQYAGMELIDKLLGEDTKIPLPDEPVPDGFEDTGKLKHGERLIKPEGKPRDVYVGGSGGAKGADTMWSVEGKKYGVEFTHYSYKGHKVDPKAEGKVVQLTGKELSEANDLLAKVEKDLQKQAGRNSLNLMRRNYYQVVNSDGIFAIGEIVRKREEKKGPKGKKYFADPPVNEVKGGTGWAVAMAKRIKGKEIHVWDVKDKVWHKWNRKTKQWNKEDTPVLTPDFAGIGSRGTKVKTKKGIQFKMHSGAEQAIADVYAKTFGVKPKTTKTHKMQMTFKDGDGGREMRPEFKGKSTMDLIKSGNRTATTRSPSQMKKNPIKKGDIIEFTGNKGVKIKVEVTSDPYSLKDISAKEWSKLEGWDTKRFNELKKKGYVQFKYKVLKEKPSKVPDDVANKKFYEDPRDDDMILEGDDNSLETNSTPATVNQNIENIKQTSATPVTDRTVSFVKRELKGLHNDDPRLIHKHAIKVDKVMKKATDYLSYDIHEKVNEVKKAFKKEFGLTVLPNSAHEQSIRQFLFYRNQSRQVPYYTMTNGKLSERPLTRKNMAQNDKRENGPQMQLEHVFVNAGGRGPAYAIWDHVVTGKDGKYKESDLSKFKADDPKRYAIYKKNAIQGFLNPKGKNAQPMYLFGGRSDAGRLYFVRYHPETNITPTSINNALKKLNVKNDGENAKKWMKSNKVSQKQYDKMVYSNMLYDAQLNGFEANAKGIEKMLAMKHRVGGKKGVIDWNKRQQIWFTNGYAADQAFFSDPKMQKQYKLGDMSDGFKFILYKDAPGNNKKRDALAEEMEQITDGGALAEEGFVDALNHSFGMPESGQNKSFIVSPNAKHGALLGKYMFHKATPEASKWMRENGIHFIMPESGAKQMGNRDRLEMNKLVRGKPQFKHNGRVVNPQEGFIYNIEVPHIKGVISEKDTNHQIENQRIPKQMLTNLSSWSYAVENGLMTREGYEKSIDDMFNDYIGDQFRGEKAINSELDAFMGDYGSLSKKEIEKKADYFVKNIDKLGVNALLKAMKTPYAPEFTTKAYRQILKKTDEIVMEQANDGELSSNEAREYFQESEGFKSLMDRMLRIEGKMKNGSLPIYYHKFIADYRMQAMRNYVVYQVTRPKAPNSLSGRMRPYDVWMRAKFKDLNKRDDIFYLDDMYMDMKVDFPTGIVSQKIKTLGEAWAAYEKAGKPSRGKFADFFQALAIRVPMDSLSGTQELKFKGFTGIKGKGIMLHGRTMEALGGADLDGDKAFAFFGMKKEYRDMYAQNKNEFLDVKKNEIMPNKEGFEDILTESGDLAEFQSPESVYDPAMRDEIQIRAKDGRDRLGPAVINRQAAIAAHQALASTGTGELIEVNRFENRKNVSYDIGIVPKTDPKKLAYARRLMRASIAYPSDPLDVAGLKSKEIFEREVFNSLFDIKLPKALKKKLDRNETAKKKFFDKVLPKAIANQTTYGKIKALNSAMYGKNWSAGRRWYFSEIQDKLQSLHTDFTPDMINTMITKQGLELSGSDWSDNIFTRIQPESIKDLYEQWAKAEPSLKKWKKQLGRTSFKVLSPWDKKASPYIKNVIEQKLYLPEVRREKALELQGFDAMMKGTTMVNARDYEGRRLNPDGRVELTEEMFRKANEFLVSDMSDISTFELLNEQLSDNPQIRRSTVVTLSKFASGLKRQDKINFKNRKEVQEADLFDDKASTFEDQLEADIDVRRFKNGKSRDGKGVNSLGRKLTPEEQDLLDIMLIGTADRGRLEEIDAYEAKYKKSLSKHEQQVIHNERMKASGTSLTRSGMNNTSVNDNVIQRMMEKYSEKLVTTFEPPEAPKVTKAKNKEKIEKPLKAKVVDAEGKESEEIIESSPYTGFEHLKRGEIEDKELRSLVDMTVDNINHWRHAFGDTREEKLENLNYFMRGVVGKDLTAMNKEDYRVLNRYLNDVRSGSWYQRNIVPHLKNQKAIPKRAYMQFPLAVGQERMMNDFILMKEKGFFENYEGKKVEGVIKKPTSYIERMQYFIGRGADLSTRYDDEQRAELRDELMKESGFDSIAEGEGLYEIAVALREQGMIPHLKNKYRADNDAFKSKRDFFIKNYQDSVNETLAKWPWKEWENKKFSVATGVKDKNEVLTGRQIVDRINKVITKRNKKIHDEWIKPNEKMLSKFQVGHHDAGMGIPKYDLVKFSEYIRDQFAKGEPLKISDFGLDGLRKIQRSMMLQSPYTNKKLYKSIIKQGVSDTGEMPPELYFPHAHIDKDAAVKSIKKGMEFIDNSTMSPTQKEAEKRKLLIRTKTLTGDWLPTDMVEMERFDGALREIAEKREGDHMKWFDSNPRTGNQMSRNNHIGGWAKDPGAYEIYQNQLIKMYYRQISQLMSRSVIEGFRENHPKGKWRDAWENFYKLYAQDAMGFPVNIPNSFLKPESEMNINGTPYKWWSDSNVRRIVNNVAKKLNIKQDSRLPEELRGFDVGDIRHWSNIEARYQMATLLAHPKSAIANIYGGTMHTIESAGWQNFRNARSVEYLRTNLPGEAKEWTARDDVTKWAIKHGVVPDFVLYEAGLNPTFKSGKMKRFLDDAISIIKKDPTVKDETLLKVAKKHQISEAIFQKAAWFMREPERALRRDAFVSHYLQARENLGSAEMDLNHPFLIEQAKKGVRATQFLYSAPYRPAFSRSALGKVMTRFQLWSWNSVRFRKDVINEAAKHGFRQGTPEFERFKRTATTDMFVLGMANIFAYSIFENALPAPYNWMQDTADWLFGNEKERDRAFFGAYPTAIAPLQVVTPPIARIGPATFSAMVNNDWSRMSGYYMYTMFPFGRMFRDVKNSVENPIRTVENMTGIPYGQFHRYMKSGGENE